MIRTALSSRCSAVESSVHAEDPQPQLTRLFGKQTYVLEERNVFLHLFVSLEVYFSSCLVLFLWPGSNGVFAKEAEMKHGFGGGDDSQTRTPQASVMN